MEERQREEGWRETETDFIIYTTRQIKKSSAKNFKTKMMKTK